jgi:hypothetical protein
VRFFAGRIDGQRRAFVMEADAGPETVAVWAEQYGADRARRRLGNPILAALVERDPGLARRYHAGLPGADCETLGRQLARRIAIEAADRIGAAAEAHGRRLAALLLPDVVSYDPARPVGFTFAGWNGRHPTDDSRTVVATVLTGAPTVGAGAPGFTLGDEFPYFQCV